MPSASEAPASPFQAVAEGVRVHVRLSPRAARTACAGLVADPAGAVALKIAVPAPPADGQANAALIRFLAREWRLPRRAFTLIAGASGRRKTLLVAGAAEPLMARLTAWSAKTQPRAEETADA